MAYHSYAADSSFFTRRGLVFIGIVVLHVLMGWGAVSGLSRQVVEAVLGPIEATIIDEMPEEQDEPPPPPPEIESPPPFVPPPDIQINIPQQQETKAIRQVTRERPPTPPPVAPPAPKPVVVAPRSNPRRPLSQPDYPPSSRRAGEEGQVVLDVYVLENGRVGEVRVRKSSGHERLDQAAVREVKRSWRLVPGTEDGKPKAMWGQFAVTFRLTD